MTNSPAPPASLAAGQDLARSSRLRRLLQRAETYRSGGQLDAAAASFESCLEVVNDHVPALLGLTDIHLRAGAHNLARRAVLRAVSGRLETPRLALDLIGALNAIGESGLMVEVAKQLPPPMWDSATSLAELAHQLSMVGAHELAREYARAAVARDPRHPPSLYVHATLDVFFGDVDSAVTHIERCLAILPNDPGSHWLLSRLRQPDAGRRIDRIGRELERAPNAYAEAFLAFALHNELHEQGDYAQAFEALERGCRAKRGSLDYSPQAGAALFAALREWRAEELAAGDGFDDADFAPVFVIGLHRSGTTLAERILGGHSRIRAGGETYDIRTQLRRASGRHFSGELDLATVQARAGFDYRSIGEGFLQGMRWRSGGRPLITDKLPSNYYNLGFIARALPRARFIHLVRDPVDVGLSSLRTLFSVACPYSYDQMEFAAHHRDYSALMDHWRAIAGDRILDIDYDQLAADPVGSATRMAAFCGLDYEPAMPAIETRNEAVSTASSVMMRDGIRRDRGKVWKAYECQLAPMIEALAG
jgi:tetratricopeptide (TPR) repeat protein